MKKGILLVILMRFACFGEATNFVGIVRDARALTDMVVLGPDGTPSMSFEPGGVHEVNWPIGIENPSGVDNSSKLFYNSIRVFVLSSSSDDSNTVAIVAMPPFPEIRGTIVLLEKRVFMTGNAISLKLKPITEDEYRKIILDLYVWKGGKNPTGEPYAVNNDPVLMRQHRAYYILEDIYDFSTRNSEKRKGDWLSVYSGYEQKIIFKAREDVGAKCENPCCQNPK
jgi:hypothetical protein